MPIESTTERRLLRALVAEDDRDVRHLLAGLLEVDGDPGALRTTTPALDLTTARARAEARWAPHAADHDDPDGSPTAS